MSPSTVAVVTDSTAALPEELVAAHHLNVVPLTVTIDSASGREGVDITAEDVAKALTARRSSISTSRPSPAEFVSVYERLLGEGVPGVVSVHLSAKLSGTCQAAQLAAAGYPGRVAVVDSRSTGMGLGFCAIAAIARTTTLFYVDTLEYLRRGGRIGAASALLGTALSVKPILHMVDGEI